jgi:hypothetical protein
MYMTNSRITLTPEPLGEPAVSPRVFLLLDKRGCDYASKLAHSVSAQVRADIFVLPTMMSLSAQWVALSLYLQEFTLQFMLCPLMLVPPYFIFLQ